MSHGQHQDASVEYFRGMIEEAIAEGFDLASPMFPASVEQALGYSDSDSALNAHRGVLSFLQHYPDVA